MCGRIQFDIGNHTTPQFRADDDRPGLVVVDPIERRQYPLETSRPVALESAPTEGFAAPVGNAVRVTTERVVLPYVIGAYVRDDDGDLLFMTDHETQETLPPGTYHVDLTTAVKTYLRVESAMTIHTAEDRLWFEFDGECEVLVGTRSHHSRPATTVTTTDDPRDVMAAVSTFGSALKTTSPERSFPTLRGHPPAVELGDELRIPDAIERPDTGVLIEVPPDLSSIYPVAPLAYYLGGEVAPGEYPRLVANGFERSLDGENGFEGEVERVLKAAFFLDCATRTEGIYDVRLHERELLEERVDIDFAALYDAPLAERLEAYLDVPFSALGDLLPTWRLAVHTTDDPANAELLPYVTADVPLVRMASTEPRADPTVATSTDIREFARAAESDPSDGVGPSDVATVPDGDAYVAPPDIDTLERAWVGDGTPLGANELLKAGFENRFERGEVEETIDITIVCNDDEMRAEVTEGRLYGDRKELPFDVTLRRDCTIDELRDALATQTDFCHYIGHVEDGAFVCRDGHLDAATIDDVGVELFLLNACRSYALGRALVEAGSVGGIVTHSDVGNAGATAIGRVVARLLNAGFSLRSALVVARGQRLVGNQYVVVGHGGATVAQAEGGSPNINHVERRGDDEYGLRIRSYPLNHRSMGSTIFPYLDDVDSHFLIGGDTPTFTLSGDELMQFFSRGELPVVSGGDLFWTSDATLDDFV